MCTGVCRAPLRKWPARCKLFGMGTQGELELIRTVMKDRKRAVLTGPAAARWIGLPTLDRVTTVDLRFRSGANAYGKSKDPRVIYRSGTVGEGFLEQDGLAYVKPIRMLFDTFRYYGDLAALVPMEAIRFHYKVSVEQLLYNAESLPRANGIRAFKDLIRFSAGTSQSPLETIGRETVLRADIPEIDKIEFQVAFEYAGPFGEYCRAVVDMLINGWLVVELDGRLKYDGTYGANTEVMLAELERQKQLQSLGLTVIRAGWRDVMSGKLIGDIRRLLRAHPKAA